MTRLTEVFCFVFLFQRLTGVVHKNLSLISNYFSLNLFVHANNTVTSPENRKSRSVPAHISVQRKNKMSAARKLSQDALQKSE